MASRMRDDSFYERYLRQHGLHLPKVDWLRRAYQAVLESMLTPKDAFVLGYNPDNGRAVYFLPEELKTHLHIMGWTQRGKTNFLKCLAKNILDKHETTGEGLAVIDPHGVLAEYVLDLCVAKGESFADKVIYFSFREDEKLAVFNPLRREHGVELVATGFVEAVAKALGKQKTMDSPLISEVLRNTVQVLLHNDLSLAEAGFFTRHTDENLAVRHPLIEAVPAKSVRDYWVEFEGLRLREKRLDTAPAARRFDHLLAVPTLKRIVGQCELGIDLASIMDEGQIAIFNLATEGAEVPLEAQGLLGALLVQEFRAVTLRRAPNTSLPFYLLIDEFGQFVSHDVMRVFTEAAKFGLRCILSHQGLWQLLLNNDETQLKDSILSIGQKVIFGGGLIEEHLALARQIYGHWVDPDKRKIEIKTKTFRPRVEKVELESRSTTRGETEAESAGETRSLDPALEETGRTEQAGASAASSYSETASLQEAFQTFYEEIEQLTNVQFETIAEQLDRQAQELYGQPVGRCVVAKHDDEPQPCQVPLMEPVGVSEEERRRFLERVYEKPFYLTPTEADGLIESRHRRLQERAVEVTGETLEARDLDPDDFWEPDEDGPEEGR